MNELILVQNQTQNATGWLQVVVQRISSDFILFSKLRRFSHSSSNLSDSRCTCCRNTFNSSAISASVGSDNFYKYRLNFMKYHLYGGTTLDGIIWALADTH